MELALFGLALLLPIMNVKLSKWLFGERREKVADTEGKKRHNWVMSITSSSCIIILYILLVFVNIENPFAVMWYLVGALIVLFGIQALMEWIYLKETKQHVIPLLLMGVGVISVIAIFSVSEWMKYTTFQEIIAEELDEAIEINYVSLGIRDLSGYTPETTARTTIRDEESIETIMHDLSEMELKKANDFYEPSTYRVSISTRRQMAEDHYTSESLTMHMDEDHISIGDGRYEIVSETDHLQKIKSLAEDDAVEWETPGEG